MAVKATLLTLNNQIFLQLLTTDRSAGVTADAVRVLHVTNSFLFFCSSDNFFFSLLARFTSELFHERLSGFHAHSHYLRASNQPYSTLTYLCKATHRKKRNNRLVERSTPKWCMKKRGSTSLISPCLVGFTISPCVYCLRDKTERHSERFCERVIDFLFHFKLSFVAEQLVETTSCPCRTAALHIAQPSPLIRGRTFAELVLCSVSPPAISKLRRAS